MGVALSSIAAFAEQKPLARFREVGYRLVLDLVSLVLPGAVNHGSDRNFNDGRFGTSAVLVFALAMRPAFRADQGFEKQGHQTGCVMIRFKNNIPAASSIAAIGAAMRDKFFPTKAAAPVATIAGFGMDSDLVDELHPWKVPAHPSQVESELSPGWRVGLSGVTFFK